MSIISQIGVVILIIFIVLVLIRSNKSLEKVSEEGEHFVDEWALREQKKEELRLMREEQKKEIQEAQSTDFLYDFEKEEAERQKSMVWEDEPSPISTEVSSGDTGKVVPMKKKELTGITLLKLDEHHKVMRKYPVSQIPFTIGRSSENDMVLDDLCVARKHCRVIKADGRYLLEDCHTTNKLFVNGTVTSQVVLSDGLRIYIGNEELQVEIEQGRSQATIRYKDAEAGGYGQA